MFYFARRAWDPRCPTARCRNSVRRWHLGNNQICPVWGLVTPTLGRSQASKVPYKGHFLLFAVSLWQQCNDPMIDSFCPCPQIIVSWTITSRGFGPDLVPIVYGIIENAIRVSKWSQTSKNAEGSVDINILRSILKTFTTGEGKN